MKLSLVRQVLPKTKFMRGVSVLVSGTAGAQILMVLASPLLTRLYGPEAFGEFAVYVALLSVLTVIASFRYQLAIPVAEKEEDAIHLLVLCLYCAAFLAVVVGLALHFFGDRIAAILSVPFTTSVSVALVLGVFLTGVLQAINYWAIRERAYRKLARAKIEKALTTIAIQLGGHLAGSISLLGGHIVGHAVSSLSLSRTTLREKRAIKIRFPKLKEQAWRYRQFPLYSTWGGLLNSAGTQLPSILFAALFSPAVAGIYMLAQRVMASPAGMINQAVGQVFFGHAREAREAGEFDKYTGALHAHLSMIAAPATAAIFVLAPYLFGVIFGDEWRVAGDYAQCLSVMIYFQFVSSPLTNVFNILEQQKKTLVYNLLLVALRAVGILVGVWMGSEYIAVLMFSILSALGYLAFSCGTTGSAGVSLSKILGYHIKALSTACLLMLTPWVLVEVYERVYAALILAILFCVGYYFFYYRAEVKNAAREN